ncbi:monooxygenase-like protein [Hypomontagnella submonticulosa]|nr:monooxygenase-like protein [Hypomontagnella submonticulosa]
METTDVIIVGAGPAGLALAISLAKFNVHSVLLEKELGITQDPRGVYLTNDAVRILWDLGVGDCLEKIGHEPPSVSFHTSSFVNAPFHALDAFGSDGFWQALPNAILHIQPMLESALRQKVIESPFCDLRCGCLVVGKQQDRDYPVIEYKDEMGVHRTIKGSFVVGADGKKGVVRKHFLEASAGIKQVDGSYRYDGTWVAANLKLVVPTPETHPEFPLWELGFTPEAVYDLFWPRGWHFCSPPGKATAAGRFGPYGERLWRHEFAQDDWDDSMDAVELLWEHLTPMITRKRDSSDKLFPCGEVTYPRDCINILRCRPYRFTHKVVNKWYDDRTILIGDAAHVFPPFGGQGIASGFRDAHQLAWRIFLLQRLPGSNREVRDRLLGAWARERHQGVKDAAAVTATNGRLCNQGNDIFFWLFRCLSWMLQHIPIIPRGPDPMSAAETRGYQPVEDGFFLRQFGGGGRLAQIYIESTHKSPMLSDGLIRQTDTVMTLLVIGTGDYENLVAEAQAAIRAINLDRSVLSESSIRVFTLDNPSTNGGNTIEQYFPTPIPKLAGMGITVKRGYSTSNYIRRFKLTTKFVIARPDFYTFALADNVEELVECLRRLQSSLQGTG